VSSRPLGATFRRYKCASRYEEATLVTYATDLLYTDDAQVRFGENSRPLNDRFGILFPNASRKAYSKWNANSDVVAR
jgi:hypothetical protein